MSIADTCPVIFLITMEGDNISEVWISSSGSLAGMQLACRLCSEPRFLGQTRLSTVPESFNEP